MLQLLLVQNSIFNLLVLIYVGFFVVLAWKNFRLALAMFVLILPAYLLKVSFEGFNTTVLEITWLAIFLVWLIRYSRADWPQIKKFILSHRYLSVAILILFFASFFSYLGRGDLFVSASPWRPLFLEPIILFFVLIARGDDIAGPDLISFVGYSTIPISLLALAQKFVSWLFPPDFWLLPPQRVTSFFNSPSEVGLYLCPAIILMGSLLVKKIKLYHLWEEEEKIVSPSLWSLPDRKLWRGVRGGTVMLVAAFALALTTIVFAFSRAAWVALAAGAIAFFFFQRWRKAAVALIIFGLLLFFFAPSLRPSAFMAESAGQSHKILWDYSLLILKNTPGRFFLGEGINGLYDSAWKYYYQFKTEPITYSHDLVINFLAETGLTGIISFVGLMVGAVVIVNRKRKNDDPVLGAGIVAAFIAIIIYGLLDTPYFKNDLAMEFWVLMSFVADSKWISDFTIWTSVNKLVWRKEQRVCVPTPQKSPWMNG